MTELGIAMDFKSQDDNYWLSHLASDSINHLQTNTSTLHVQTLNDSLAKELISTQDANKCATQMLDTKDKKADLQSIVKDSCKHLSTNCQRSYCSFSLIMSHLLMAP
jgi:hypothetical protein